MTLVTSKKGKGFYRRYQKKKVKVKYISGVWLYGSKF